MSIPENSPARGCASSYAYPVTRQDELEAQALVNNLEEVNCEGNGVLNAIRYRIGSRNSDITRHVFRWQRVERQTYQDAFQNGIRAVPDANTDPFTRYDLLDFINNAGAPLSLNRPRRHVFISSTLSSSWRPVPDLENLPPGGQIQAYRYEIYAPGGIWVAATLAGLYQHVSQAEITFVGGIAPQYIRSAQLYTITRPARGANPHPHYRSENTIIINRNFNPFSALRLNTPQAQYQLLLIQGPIEYYVNGTGDREVQRFLSHQFYPPHPPMRRKRQVSNNNLDDDAVLQWYTSGVAYVSSYIDAAIRSSTKNEAYIFMKNEYVLLNYAPHSTGDWIVNGPLLICDGFPSLIDTPFGEYGIDCAFDTAYNNEAFIFSINLCACIDYAPGTTDDKMLIGPKTIASMFPFFKGTVFEHGVDAAFRSTVTDEAYLFQGDQYALINYSENKLVTNIQNITRGFPCLRNTKFATGIDAAFASHTRKEVYLFKGEHYALISFTPHTTDGYMIDYKVKPLLPNWPSLKGILPRKNGGLDVYQYKNHGHNGADEQADL